MLEEGVDTREQAVSINVAPSATGTHYIEFGSLSARLPGKRETKGVVLKSGKAALVAT
jgi:hypothetical protein